MLLPTLLACWLTAAAADVSHLLSSTTPDPPPKPYVFSYTAGRFPGHADRQHTEVSDGSGVIRGKYAYVDPRNQLRTVDYIADKQGFHPVLNEQPPDHPKDSDAVAHAKNRHYQLYNRIAEQHQHQESALPRQSAAVALATAKHANLFRVIAEQHARIAAEREALQREDEEKQQLQDLQHYQQNEY